MVLGGFLRRLTFHVFFDRQKVDQKSENSGMLAAKGRPPAIFGSGLRQGGGPRRGKERTSSPISADAAGVSGKYENQAFFVGVWGKENLEELGELELGELEEGAWILIRRVGVAILNAVRRGTADLKATTSCRRPQEMWRCN